MELFFLNMSFPEKLYNSAIAFNRWKMILGGVSTTVQISIGAIFLGVFIGCIITFMRMSQYKVLNFISSLYIDIIRGTPAVTQLLIINFTFFASVRGAGVLIGIVAMGINSGAYVGEIIRAGLLSVDRGQMEAGRSLGLNQKETMIYIIMPQAIKNILPALANEFIVLIKETAIIGYIAVEDLTKVGQNIMSKTFSVEPLFITAFIYFIIIKVLSTLLKKLEIKLRVSDAR